MFLVNSDNGKIVWEGNISSCYEVAWMLKSINNELNFKFANLMDLSNSFWFDYFAC